MNGRRQEVGMQSARMLARKDFPALHYLSEGAGHPVVLIHGVGADLHSWDTVAPALVEHYRVIRADLRGHGKSGRISGPHRLDDFVADVLDAMDACGVRKADIVGFSLGGMIAQALALDHGERVDRLAIISAVCGRNAEEREKVRSRLAILRDQGIEAITAAAEDRWFTAEFRQNHPDKVNLRLAQLRANDPESYKSAYTVFCTADLGERTAAIRHKTLVATGENDQGSNTRMARFMHDAIPGSELHILPKLKHSLLVEAPEKITELLLGFLKR